MADHSTSLLIILYCSLEALCSTREVLDEMIETRNDSSVLSINNTSRLCRIMTMLPLTAIESDEEGNTKISPRPFNIYYEAGAFVATQHFNARNDSVIPGLSERLKTCDIQISLSMEDSKFSPIEASRNLLRAINVANHSMATPRLTALVGADRSAVSIPLSVVTGVSKILQVSPSSTSPALDSKGVSPYFGRMVSSH